MKAKYYPEGSILTASIGSNPSFAWRSIHGSCGLLNEGLIWRVRNGKKIRIWQERWLPNAVTYKVMSPPTVLNPSATVSELIKEDTGWWDSELLNRIFIPEEVDLIQAMPISSTNQDDILVWRGAKTGLFSVRSAYYIQLELEKRYTAASFNNTGTSKIWTSLWALKIPNVEKKIIWKACHDILPTKANLCKRKIIDDPLCPLCESETETVLHALWQCPAAVDAWSMGCTRLQKKSFNIGKNFLQVVEEIFLQCDLEETKQFVGIARRLWLRRNEVVHGGRMMHPNDLVSQTKTAMVEFAEATDREAKTIAPALGGHIERNIKWQPPDTGWAKANWDASLAKDKGWMGFGVVVRDEWGQIIAAQTKSERGCLEPTMAEARAALLAISLCKTRGLNRIIFEGDAQVVIKAIHSEEVDGSCLGVIVADIKSELQAFPQWRLAFVRREGNEMAHFLSREATKTLTDRSWLNEVPECLNNELRTEHM
jgi:ribonuclease HI